MLEQDEVQDDGCEETSGAGVEGMTFHESSSCVKTGRIVILLTYF